MLCRGWVQYVRAVSGREKRRIQRTESPTVANTRHDCLTFDFSSPKILISSILLICCTSHALITFSLIMYYFKSVKLVKQNICSEKNCTGLFLIFGTPFWQLFLDSVLKSITSLAVYNSRIVFFTKFCSYCLIIMLKGTVIT